jgi:hypothetical protein
MNSRIILFTPARSLIAIVFLLTINTAYSQRPVKEKITVTGKVTDASNSGPLEYATVSFTSPAGQVVGGGITDLEGNFAIQIPVGTYKVTYEFIGFKTKTLAAREFKIDETMPTISLAIDSESLDEVVVRAETTQVQVRLDKKIYNIGKDLTTSGATVGDALGNVPSVTVDVDGSIALRGNENVRILINGRPSALAGFGSTDALRALPAESIDRVEVITSPSARYDAEGTAGILNIILKKEKTRGLNGSVQLNAGYPASTSLNGNINWRTDKFNIFNTTGYRYRESPGNASFDNFYLSPNVDNPLVLEDRIYDRQDQNINTNLGIEYFVSDKTSITATGFFSTGMDEDETINETDEFNRITDTDGRLTNLAESRNRTENETEEDTNYQFSLNYITRFNETGHELTADFQYEDGREEQTSLIAETQTFPDRLELPSEFITTNEDESEYLIQSDYVLPIGEDAQFEAGFRGSYESTTTDYELTEQVIAGGNFVRNDSLSNIFTYDENVTAVYSQYGNKFGKFSFLAGLRFEYTQLVGDVEADDVTTIAGEEVDLDFDKSYSGLFPTLNLVYEIGDRENITLGYNRRINRPRGFFINPFPSRSSEANVFQGNPDLDPAFSNSFDLGYLKRWKEVTLTSSVYFQRETDAFERIQEQTGQVTSNGIPIIRRIPINLSSNERIGFEAGLLYNPADWLRLNGSFNFFQFTTEGDFNGINYDAKNTSYFARGSAKVTLPEDIEWQTNVFYRGPSNNAQTDTEGLLSVDLAFSKDIFGDNATIGFNVRDVFNSRIRRSFTESQTFLSDSEFQWRERSFNVSFIYRFNQKKERRQNSNRGDDDGDFEG